MMHAQRLTRLVARHPLGALFVKTLRIRESTDATMATAAIDQDGTIYVNEAWADTLSDQEYLGMLYHLHTVWYVSPKQRERRAKLAASLWNLANDLVLNAEIRRLTREEG